MIFTFPREKKRLFLTSQGYSELWRCSGMGGGELVLSTEFVNLISHRKKDLRADPSSYILSEYNRSHHPLTFTSPVSLNKYLKVAYTCGERQGVGTREKRGEMGAGGGRQERKGREAREIVGNYSTRLNISQSKKG